MGVGNDHNSDYGNLLTTVITISEQIVVARSYDEECERVRTAST